MIRYPRDLRGYGPNPPDPRWPNGARVAVQIVLNFEEGSENCLLHGDPACEAFLSEIVGAAPWEGERHWNMESIYEYGARAGFWRLHRLLSNVPVTVFGVATALARAPEQVAAMQGSGWEIASHGLKWIEHRQMTEQEERSQIEQAVRLHSEVTGTPPSGWYTGRCSMNTVRLAAEHGFAYVADSYADDLPYWHDGQLIVPYTLDANDMRFATAQGFNSGDQFFSYLRDSFDCLYEEGGRMMSVGLHCRLAGRPGRAMALKRFLNHVREHESVWFATRLQIADHWAREHPQNVGPKRRQLPSELPLVAFVERFGEIFESSPWIAERAHALELGPAHDCAAGLHNAMVRVFRSASRAERLWVLRAHPDLVGKLAAAGQLTAASTAEQAAAGLDTLTEAERERFSELNRAYTERHGFPFIIAVRDHGKGEILTAFTRRLEHDTESEICEACTQVERIAELRLQELLA